MDRPGTCAYCEGTFGSRSITRHIKACPQRPRGVSPALLLVVESRHDPAFWLRVVASPTATFETLDKLLRRVWLECCGHLSSFSVDDVRYEPRSEYDMGWGPPPRSLTTKLGRALSKGTKLAYTYDFGSSTELVGRVASVLDDAPLGPALALAARNDMPEVLCAECDAPAICIDVFDRMVALCAEHGDVSDEGCLPVVNSPRMGVCGYMG